MPKLYLRSTSSALLNIFDEITRITAKDKQNPEIAGLFLKKSSVKKAWELGFKIDAVTGIGGVAAIMNKSKQLETPKKRQPKAKCL